MTYELEYADTALEGLAAVPLELQGAVEANLMRLAAAPTELSRPIAFPYAPPGQLFPFNVTTAEGAIRRFTVVFLYRTDQRVLHVTHVIYHQPN